MALLMGWERSSSDSGFVIFVFLLFSCSYETQMIECFTKSKYDHLLFTLFFMFVSPTEHFSLKNFSGSWRVIVADF
jgi:hypothetical protein